MEIDILNERENPLLERKEISFRVIYEGATPNIKDIRNKLIEFLKSDSNLTVVGAIKPEFGRSAAQGYVKIYGNSEALAIEPEHRLKKNLLTSESEEKPKEEKPKEKPKEEKPKEKPKEEKPKEKPKEEKPKEKPKEEKPKEKPKEEKPKEKPKEEKPKEKPKEEKPKEEKPKEESKENKEVKKNG